MIMDAQLLFTGVNPAAGIGNADNTDSPTTGTQNSTNIIDLHGTGLLPVLSANQGARDMGVGDDPALKMLVVVTASFAGGTSLQIILQGAQDNGSGAPTAYGNWWSSPVYTEAQLNQGSRLYDMDLPRPPDGQAMPRFLRLGYVSVGTHTSGKILGTIVLDRIDQPYNSTDNATLGGYPAGITVAN